LDWDYQVLNDESKQGTEETDHEDGETEHEDKGAAQEATNLISFQDEEVNEDSDCNSSYHLENILNVSTQNLLIKNKALEDAYTETNEKTNQLRIALERVSLFIIINNKYF
jgi:hypothetical protein